MGCLFSKKIGDSIPTEESENKIVQNLQTSVENNMEASKNVLKRKSEAVETQLMAKKRKSEQSKLEEESLKKMPCSDCENIFETQEQMEEQKSSVHFRFKCNDCNKCFPLQSSLEVENICCNHYI